jgi:hypothetical protein
VTRRSVLGCDAGEEGVPHRHTDGAGSEEDVLEPARRWDRPVRTQWPAPGARQPEGMSRGTRSQLLTTLFLRRTVDLQVISRVSATWTPAVAS